MAAAQGTVDAALFWIVVGPVPIYWPGAHVWVVTPCHLSFTLTGCMLASWPLSLPRCVLVIWSLYYSRFPWVIVYRGARRRAAELVSTFTLSNYSCSWGEPTKKHTESWNIKKNGEFSTGYNHPSYMQQHTLSYRHTYPSLLLYTPTCIGFRTILLCKNTTNWNISCTFFLEYWLVSFLVTVSFLQSLCSFFWLWCLKPRPDERRTHCGWGTVDILWTLVFIRPHC